MRMAYGLHHPNSFDGASIRHFGRPDEASALLYYFFGAANGDQFSQAALGYRHTFGLGVPKSCWTAVSYYKPVAEAVVQAAVDAAKNTGPLGSTSGRGLPHVERIRLNVHANQGIKPDRQREVLQYYQYSADRGNIDAQTTVGTLLNFGTHGVSRDHAAAAHYLQRAAAAGSDEAMAHLGHMYGAGLGVPQDYEQALKYFKRSAAKQNPLGLYGLGYMYLAGKGVEQSHQTALKFFQQAAEHGDRDAHFYLGAMYMHGLGVPRRSLSKGFMHYFQAASLGHVQAMYNVAIMHMTGKGTAKACKPALSNLKALVEKGPLAAALQAGHEAFFRGQHAQAVMLYLQASELGMEIAQSNAAWMLDRGFTHAGPHAATVATTLFKRSAEQGNVMSLLQLGDCYYYGNGVEQDWVRASAIYYEAYKERSPEAMFNLGFMHEFGAGVPQDMHLALKFYNMAKHTNADAALPVYLATAWLRAHKAWQWLRPHVPKAAAAYIDWLFEVRPAAGSSAAAVGTSSSSSRAVSGDVSESGSTVTGGPKAAPALPPSGTPSTPAAADAATSSTSRESSSDGVDSDAYDDSQERWSWLWWLSPAVLIWKLDSFLWRLAEAAGIGGSSISALLEDYADTGETILLIVLFAVLVLVLRIRSQRQQAVENRIRMALAAGAGEDQQLAQQLAAQMGLQIPAGLTAAQRPQTPAAGSAAGSPGNAEATANSSTAGPSSGSDSSRAVDSSSVRANGGGPGVEQEQAGAAQQ
eukprot:GHUV01016127.1.p1 GENE.GHUV01016127.1~~GHUV01016127.1.p1  ORF type:complete len:751 (+),score=236.62 GHUV01016127.1:451-2703(+)